MEKEVPKKFNSLIAPEKKTNNKDIEGVEAKLEKRETLNKETKETGEKQDDNKKNDKEGKSIIERVKPRPNKKVKDATKSNKKTETDDANTKKEGETAEKGKDGERPKRDPAKTRCNFWPTCKNTDCPFVHPSEQVM